MEAMKVENEIQVYIHIIVTRVKPKFNPTSIF
jgi:hypothetical protein